MAITFNGTSQYAHASIAFPSQNAQGPTTLAFFVKTNAPSATFYPLALFHPTQAFWMLAARGDATPALAGRARTVTESITTFQAITDGSWTPIVVTNATDGTVSIYAGSTTPVTANAGAQSATSYSGVCIGAFLSLGSSPQDYMPGKVAYSMIYNRVWTAGEISTYINATSVADINSISTASLEDRWDLISDGSSDAAGTNLTLVGSPTFDADDPLAAVGGVTVTDVDADEDVCPGQTVTITGTGFGATQSSGAVTIDGVAQVVTSWADTSIQITVTQGDLKYGSHTLQVTNSLAESGTLGITLSADTANNYLYVDVVDPANSDSTAFSYNTTPAVATGDQLEVQFFAPITSMTVQADTLISSVDSAGTAAARFWDATTSTWGPIETFDIAESGAVDNWPFGKGINPAAPETWTWGKRHPKTGMRVRVYK